LASLVNRTSGLPVPGRENLVNYLRSDVLATLAEYCKTAAAARPFCKQLDPTTGLPTGDLFHGAVWNMLNDSFLGIQRPALVRPFCRPLHAQLSHGTATSLQPAELWPTFALLFGASLVCSRLLCMHVVFMRE
jgi:hypothetical protein